MKNGNADVWYSNLPSVHVNCDRTVCKGATTGKTGGTMSHIILDIFAPD